MLKRDAMLIRVEADNGLVGYGPGEGSEKAKHAIETVIAPFLEGRTAGRSGCPARAVRGRTRARSRR